MKYVRSYCLVIINLKWGLIADKEIVKMKINGIESSQILTSILENLYKKLENPATNLTFALKVIDSPDVAKAIF